MIKRLAGCIRQYKRDTVLTPLFMLGEVSCECVIPLLTAELINNIQASCSMNVILQFGLKLFLVAMLSLACGSASGWFCASAAAGFAQNLRRDLYYKVQDFSFSNIDRFSTSSLVTRLTTDVSNVQQAFMMMIRMAVRAPMMLIFATVMSIQVGKQLAFIFAGIIPVLGFCLYLMAKTAMPLFKAVFKKYDRLNNSVQENVQAMRVVKSFVREDYETEKFTAESDDVRGDFLRAEKILALNNPLMQFCISVCRILISYFAAKLIVQSGGTYLNVGALTSMITYSMQSLMGLMMLSMVFVMITMASASAKRICEVLDEALASYNQMRATEGKKLAEDIGGRLDTILRCTAQVEERSPETVAEYRAKLTARMQEVLQSTTIDESRILTEAAIYADKVAVDEETVRLRSHVAQLRTMLESDQPMGRKMDFLIQEVNRESNTIGSKCNDVAIAQVVVGLKAVVEKMREQVQNVE